MNAPVNRISVPPIVATCHGVEVPAAPHLSRGMVRALNDGRYEANEIACGLAAIRPGARILELGAGSGVVGAVLALNCRPCAILSVEANPDLIAPATALYAHNGLSSTISLRHGIVMTDPAAPETVEFFLRINFLSSGLTTQKPERSRKVTVPVLDYDTLKAGFPHDTIMMDIEGAELDFLRHADLSAVHTFIAEMHPVNFGREGLRECRRHLRRGGLVMNAGLCRGGVEVWQRT